MTRIFDISGELPEGVPAALERLDAHFRDHEVPYLLVGASARDAGRLASQGLRDKVNTIVESQRQNLIQDMGTALASEQLAAFVLGLQAA